ncbi:MAG: LysR family transcriptional regulator [Cryobacterium sp.]|nr:LysR family transcriptional regulator [Cryobacterium sp.]
MTFNSSDFTIDLRKIRLLRELSARGTVTAAAAALHLTPSAVSQQLAGLSRELGVPLLERRGRGVSLTGQARLLLSHADAVQEQLELTRAALASWSGGTVGEVRVGSLATGIAALVAPALARLRDERPQLVVRATELDGDEGLALLDAGELDLIVVSDFLGAPTRQDARYHRVDLIADVMDVVLPADHPLADPNGVRLADLAGEVWVGAEPGDSCAHIITGVCAAAGFVPDTRHHCREWDAVAALVSAGVGVALIPRLAFPLRQQDVVVCPVLGQPASRVLFALARAGTQLDPGTAVVVDTLRAVAAERLDGIAAGATEPLDDANLALAGR